MSHAPRMFGPPGQYYSPTLPGPQLQTPNGLKYISYPQPPPAAFHQTMRNSQVHYEKENTMSKPPPNPLKYLQKPTHSTPTHHMFYPDQQQQQRVPMQISPKLLQAPPFGMTYRSPGPQPHMQLPSTPKPVPPQQPPLLQNLNVPKPQAIMIQKSPNPTEIVENRCNNIKQLFKNAFELQITESHMDPRLQSFGFGMGSRLPESIVLESCDRIFAKGGNVVTAQTEKPLPNHLSSLHSIASLEKVGDNGNQFEVFHLDNEEINLEVDLDRPITENLQTGETSVQISQPPPQSVQHSTKAEDDNSKETIKLLSTKYEELQKDFGALKKIADTQSQRMSYMTTKLLGFEGEMQRKKGERRGSCGDYDESEAIFLRYTNELQTKDLEIARLSQQLNQQKQDYETRLTLMQKVQDDLLKEVTQLKEVKQETTLSKPLFARLPENFDLFSFESNKDLQTEACVHGDQTIVKTEVLKRENEMLWMLINLCDKELASRGGNTPASAASTLIPTLSSVLSMKTGQPRGATPSVTSTS